MEDDKPSSGGILGAIVGIAAAIAGAFSAPSDGKALNDYVRGSDRERRTEREKQTRPSGTNTEEQ